MAPGKTSVNERSGGEGQAAGRAVDRVARDALALWEATGAEAKPRRCGSKDAAVRRVPLPCRTACN